jgi:hypothetical protein
MIDNAPLNKPADPTPAITLPNMSIRELVDTPQIKEPVSYIPRQLKYEYFRSS